jgi:hypothetical protein
VAGSAVGTLARSVQPFSAVHDERNLNPDHPEPDHPEPDPTAGDRAPDGRAPDGEAAPDSEAGASMRGSGADPEADAAADPEAGASTRDPDDRESPYELLRRGQALAAKRHFAQAAIVLGRAARLEPRKGSILEALGRALYNSGQHERARETFERLLEVDPSSDYGHYALGQSLKQLGRRREARTHLRIAVALAPSSRLYAGALRRLGPEPGAGDRPDRGSRSDPHRRSGGARVLPDDAGPEAGTPPDADPTER